MPEVEAKPTRTCAHEGCDRPVKGKGLCSVHYAAQYRAALKGKPSTPAPEVARCEDCGGALRVDRLGEVCPACDGPQRKARAKVEAPAAPPPPPPPVAASPVALTPSQRLVWQILRHDLYHRGTKYSDPMELPALMALEAVVLGEGRPEAWPMPSPAWSAWIAALRGSVVAAIDLVIEETSLPLDAATDSDGAPHAWTRLQAVVEQLRHNLPDGIDARRARKAA